MRGDHQRGGVFGTYSGKCPVKKIGSALALTRRCKEIDCYSAVMVNKTKKVGRDHGEGQNWQMRETHIVEND